MPPKKATQEQAEAPPPVDPAVKDSEALGDYFGELRDASTKGAVADLVEPAAGRKWQLAVTRAVEEGATTAAAGPEEYADWVRRFGFSVEREIQLREAETLKMKTQTTKNARHLAHLRAAEKQQVSEDIAATAAKLPMAGPLPERPPPFPYAVARDQVDTITSMQLKPGAGDAFTLTRGTSYDDVDFHALVNVGACHTQAVGSRPQDEANANLALDQVVSALVQPYQTTTWRLSAFDAAHFKIRAIARWIAAFVRVVPPPLGPPPAAGGGTSAAPVPAPPATGKGKADGPSVSISAPGGKAGAASPTTWMPYRVEDNDDDADADGLPELADAGDGAASVGEEMRGFATAHAVFQTRVGDPHQIAVLFAFMCRLPAAGIVFTTHRGADAAVAGGLRIETDAAPASYSALRSSRPSVAVPSGVAAAYVEGRLHPTPAETLSTAVGGAQPCRVRVVRGTLKGSIDAQGKPLGYLPWSWNAVTLPDGKQYLLDVSLCAANVPVKFLLQHHLSCLAVSAGEMSATAGAEGAAPAAGGKDKGAKDKAAASAAAAPSTGASSVESVAAALTAGFGNYTPVAGHLQFHRHAEIERVAAALSQPHSDAAREAMVITPTSGTRGYHNAALLVQSGTGVTPAIGCTAVACVKAGVPHNHAQGPWAETQPAGAQGPLGLGQLAAMMSRTCFEPAYFLSDPRHFATLHYPDDQAMLLLAPTATDGGPGSVGGASTQEGASSHHRRHGARLVTKAQWETYPRLTHSASNMGFALESHARRGNFTAKGCPVYMSFVLGDAPHTELQVTVFRGGLQAVLNSQVAAAHAAPAEGMSPEAYSQQADLQQAAALRQVQAGYQVICHAPGSAAAAAANGASAGGAGGTPAAAPHATTAVGGAAPPTLSVVDPTYYALSREERNRRSVLSLMLPDVGLYSVCVGARKLDGDGRPLSSVFSLMTAYQMNVSFVPTNEPLMPRIREPATVAKLVAPATSRIAGGQTYFAIAPTLPKVIAAVVINEVAAVTIKPKKDPLGNSASMGASSRPGADGTIGADGGAPKPLHKDAFTKIFFLPWDSNTATFNGTCAIEPGTVTLWLGLRHEAVHDDPLASMVPPHLLPSATSASTAQLLAHMLADPSAAHGGMPPPPGTAAESQRPGTAATESSGGGVTGPPLPKTAFEVLQAIQAASKPPPGAPAVQPLTGSSLAAAWKPASSQPEDTTETVKPAKGKGKSKPSAAAAAPAPPPPVVKPPPAAVFVPFVTSVSAVRRIPSKEAGLLTNGYSIGAEEPPADIDSYVPPKSLLYMPPTTGSEQRVTHGILAKTVDAETVDIVAKQREAVGGVFVGKERPVSM